MKILVISAAFPPNKSGEATNAYYMCQRLVERGIEVEVLTSVGNTPVTPSSIRVHATMRSWSWDEVPRLLRLLRRCSPDAVYLMYLGWTYNFQFMSTFIPTIAKWALPKVPFVTRFENVAGAGPQTNTLMSRVIRKAVAKCSGRGADYQFGTLLRDSDTIVLLSSGHETILEDRLPDVGKKCVLIPPPVNMCMSASDEITRIKGRQALGAGPADFLMSYIGYLYPGKGIETLLEALKLLTTQRPQVRLAIIGGSIARVFEDQPDYLATLRALASDLGVADRVVWTGDYRWDSDEASTFLRASDACVLPFDGGVHLNNSSFASATAHDLPVITTRGTLLEPQFVHGKNVFLCQPKSPTELAAAITTVVDDPTLRRTLSHGSQHLARQWYSWGTAVDKTLALLGDSHQPADDHYDRWRSSGTRSAPSTVSR